MIQRIPYEALTNITSAQNVARNGNPLVTLQAAPGAIAVVCSASITTAAVLATFKLQASPDGVTFYDISGGTNSPIVFSTAAGTGSEVVTTKILTFDIAAHAFSHVRVVATLTGAATASADKTRATMFYVPAGKLPA